MKTILIFFLTSCVGFAAIQNNDTAIQGYETAANEKGINDTVEKVTLSVWVKMTLLSGNTTDIISKGITTVGTRILYNLRRETNYYKFRFTNPAGTEHTWRTTSTYPTNVLVHLAVTFMYSNASSLTMYVDGQSVAGGWVDGTGAQYGVTNDQKFMVSGQHFGSTFRGYYNECAVWNEILDARQIENLYLSGVKTMPLQFKSDKIILYFPFNDQPPFSQIGNAGLTHDIGPRRNTGIFFSALPNNNFLPENKFSYPPNE